MARITDHIIPNPFGGLVAQLHDQATTADRREAVLGELAAAEAQELAWGYRHLVIDHGDPTDLPSSRHLCSFYGTVAALATEFDWARVCGAAEQLTITVRGPAVDRELAAFVEAAGRANPGHWTVALAAWV